MEDLADRVVVITGASSGIGRATALAFARRGATVALAARRAEQLRQVKQECVALGGRALCVPTDTSQEEQVEALAERVLQAFGRIDVWVNSAAVLALGRVEEVPAEDNERLIRTNLFGYLCGTRIAVRQFRRQGHGLLVNNASVLGAIGARRQFEAQAAGPSHGNLFEPPPGGRVSGDYGPLVWDRIERPLAIGALLAVPVALYCLLRRQR